MQDGQLDTDVLILEQLDFSVVCTLVVVDGDPDCTNKASWLYTARCCASEWYACEEHRKRALQDLKDYPNRACVPCGYIWDASRVINRDWTRL